MVTKTTPPASTASAINQPETPWAERRRSTYELPLTPFSDEVIKAASKGQLKNTEPFLSHMASIKNLSEGLAVVLRIVGNNCILEDGGDMDNPESEPRLGDYSIGAMVKMAEEVCRFIGADIEHVAKWAEKHVRHEEQK